ncbi:hypothetical protein ACHAXR_004553 [Thalassiosira sp. AJA248-18]
MMDPCSSRQRANDGRNQMAPLAAAIFLVCAVIAATPINGFLCNKYPHINGRPTTTPASTNSNPLLGHLSMATNNNNDDGSNSEGNDDTSTNDDASPSSSSPKNNNEKNVLIDEDELSWRVAKVRLEDANTQRFLRRKPIKLSYSQSQKWIQMNWAPETKQEFEDLVANGNLRTPYISKRPEEYYGERGEWISWDHYLLGNSTDDISKEVPKWQ